MKDETKKSLDEMAELGREMFESHKQAWKEHTKGMTEEEIDKIKKEARKSLFEKLKSVSIDNPWKDIL